VPLRLKPWQKAALSLVLLTAAVALAWWRISSTFDAPRMIAALPSEHAVVFYADVAALRRAGILDLLAGSKSAEDADYRKFVADAGFDYRTDLDAVAAAFVDHGSYLTVRGRFQWTRLRAYAKAQGGDCHDSLCNMPGNSPGRQISFVELQPDILALAVAADPAEVTRITTAQRTPLIALAPEPLWITAPSSELTKPGALSPALLSLIGPVAHAERVTLALGPRDQNAQLRLSIHCKSPNDASAITRDLSSAMNALNTRGGPHAARAADQPDWVALLRLGTVSAKGSEVTGIWPLDRAFLSGLFSASGF
jgi:hypothetical protein